MNHIKKNCFCFLLVGSLFFSFSSQSITKGIDTYSLDGSNIVNLSNTIKTKEPTLVTHNKFEKVLGSFIVSITFQNGTSTNYITGEGYKYIPVGDRKVIKVEIASIENNGNLVSERETINFSRANNSLALSSLAAQSTKSTYGKMFWWGYQVYFSHQTMIDIENAMNLTGDVSSAAGLLSATLAGTAASIGLAASALALFVVINYHIAKAFDHGQGVTLTQEIWGPGVYWFNSGDVVQQ